MDFASLLGLLDVTADVVKANTLVVQNDLTVLGNTTLNSLMLPTSAVAGQVLTCTNSTGSSSWQMPADAALAGDCSGPGSNNIVTKASGNFTVNNTISSASGLNLSSSGFYGPSKVTIQNISGCNGMLLDTTGSSVALTDVVCKSGTKAMNMRFEARTASLLNALNSAQGEYQVLLNNSLTPAAYFGTAASGIYGTLNAAAVSCTGLKMTTGAGLAKVLTSDPSGNATWMDPAEATSVGNLTMSGYLYNPEGRFLLANKSSASSLYLGEGGDLYATGTHNVVCGPSAYNITTASYTTAVGTSALPSLTTAFYTTAVGYQSLPTLTVGNSNTGVGVDSGRGITTGTNNTFLGEGTNATVGSISNSTCVGSGAFVTASNTVQIGGAGVTNVNTVGLLSAPSVTTGVLSATAASVENLNARSYRAPTAQGTYMTWNREGGTGKACWGNQRGLGSGGHEWVDYDIGTSTTTVGMSLAGNLLTLGGVNFPKNGVFGNTLAYYEEFMHTTAWLGPVSTDPYNVEIIMIGKQITMYVKNGPAWVTTTAGIIGWKMGALIPIRFRPTDNVTGVLIGKNNGVTTLLNVLVDSLGGVTLSVALTSTAWVGNIGFNTFSISWTKIS